jgi:hypothetical protein
LNRIEEFIPCCDTCRAENRRRRVSKSIASIEAIIGTDVVEYVLPTLDRMMQAEPAAVELGFMLWPDAATVGDDLALHAAHELREIGERCLALAAKLEGGRA